MRDIAEPKREKLRRETADPSCDISTTDKPKTEPTRVSPTRDNEEPKRPNPRKDNEDPRREKSITDRLLDRRLKLRTDKDDPRHL